MATQQAISSVVNVNEIEFFGWSYSTITLACINAQPNRWSTFVANRVAEIQDVIPPSKWSHVPTKLNPADAASRGTSQNLLSSNLWWHGPPFLLVDKTQWPKKPTSIENPPEQRKAKVTSSVSQSLPVIDVTRFQIFSRLLRTTVFALRFVKQLKRRQRLSSVLTSNELEDAELSLRQHQKEFFSSEQKLLHENK